MKKDIVAATGHRPDKCGGYLPKTHTRLRGLALMWLGEHRPDRVLCGMAQGWDQAVCEAALQFNIPVHAYIPFKGQELIWPLPAKRFYDKLLRDCEEVVIYSPKEDIGAFHGRNRLMVDRCTRVLAFWNGDEAGGTWSCIKYAKKQEVPIINLYRK